MSHVSRAAATRSYRIGGTLPALALVLLTSVAAANPDARTHEHNTQLSACGSLALPQGVSLVFHAYAKGVQIYRWNGSAWSFVAPAAVLYADAGYTAAVGIHYEGPKWQSVSGSTVRGSVVDRCTADPSAIQWLSLSATPEDGPGVFQDVSFIQRVNTTAGLAPSYAGTVVDEIARVPYTAEYLFYR